MSRKKRARFQIVPVTDSARHEAFCSICKHRDREAIERDFIEWESPARIARQYKIGSRTSVYRHARALALFPKRDKNIRAALARIIEKGSQVRVTASVVVQAIAVYAKINSAGLWVDRRETVNVNDLFEKMSNVELAQYARDGKLPDWFTQTVGGTALRANESAGGLE